MILSVLVVGILSIGWGYMESFTVDMTTSQTTQIHFSQSEINMGHLERGKPKTVSFQFKNTGENPLMIHNVEASCGCTKPQWPRQPITPGQSGEIKVTYDAKYPGRFMKSVKVFCNSEKGMVELLVKGEVAFDE